MGRTGHSARWVRHVYRSLPKASHRQDGAEYGSCRACRRFAGGRAYGYKRVIKLDARGEIIRGLLEIDTEQVVVVERIFTEFAAGASSIQIATRLNADGIPGPRGGHWNASTIRRDPKKATGILNNPLYVGRLVWGRRQWRRNPDSEKREGRYRLRDRAEWVEVAVPAIRIVDDGPWEAVQTQLCRRRLPDANIPVARRNRRRHLLSGLIKCSCCGSSDTISGKTITAAPARRSAAPVPTPSQSARRRSRRQRSPCSSITC
jgi:hypothetical protein